MRYISPTILIAFSGILLMFSILYINKRVIVNLRFLSVIIILVSLMLFKTIIDGTELNVILNFMFISIPPLVIFSYRFDSNAFMETCYNLSFVNFFLLVFLPLLDKKTAYMRFGYGIILTVIFSYLLVFRGTEHVGKMPMKNGHEWRRLINLGILIVSSIELVLFGCRGSLAVFLVFVAIDVLMIYRKHTVRNFLLILAGFIAYFNMENIVGLLVQLTAHYGIYSYTIRKFQYQMATGLEEASSGRGKLYQEAINIIRENPLIGIRMINYEDGTKYVHNLFLQVGRDMGVIVMILSIIFVLYCLYILYAKGLEVEKKTIIAVIFCVSVGRLMVSSLLWSRPEFWILMCIVLNYKTIFDKYMPSKPINPVLID